MYFQLLWHRLVGASVIILWATAWSCGMFGLLKCCGKLRVTEQQELKGEIFTLAENQTLKYNYQTTPFFVNLVLWT
jgi:ammonia channel protein AmtB